MKKKKNAFTLIELLAIIVILAIIAVITVPIILNIIENSRKGAATNSAYGYKDTIQQYYISKLVGGTNDAVLTTETIKTVSELETDGLTVSGDKPSDGWVQLNKGQVVDYSLKFGDYAVSFDTTTNEAVSIKNGELKEQPVLVPTIASCPGCKFIYTKSTYVIGTDTEPEGATNDYTTLSSHPYFLGFTANSTTGIIERGFVCGIHNGTAFCLEGEDEPLDETYVRNESVLSTAFSGSCSSELEAGFSGISCDLTNITAEANNWGCVDIYDEYGICQVNGTLVCMQYDDDD